ncbi:hypothetical protein DRQ25_17870, partial [Candidatus Fermentibacteria bacterium]
SWAAFRKWKKETYALINVKKLLAIKHPFRDIKPPKKITHKHKALLKECASLWDSVWVSVWGSVWDSVGDSIRVSIRDSVGVSIRDSVWGSVKRSVWNSLGDSVGDSIWDSICDSVWGSLGNSVLAQMGDGFRLKRSDWKHTEKIKTKGYPFACYVKLWNMGLVPTLDGKVWRLHGGKKAKVLYEISKKELEVRK